MARISQKPLADPEVRHFIYSHFAETSRPPSTIEIAAHFSSNITLAEQSLRRLAETHQIALAPGTCNIWMAHPFSALPTNFVTEVGGKKYWGN